MLVVEARDRVGGRVLNHHLHADGVIEAGGDFVGPTQDRILRLADDLGVKTFKEYAEGDNVYVKNGQRSTYTGTVPPDPSILLDAALLQQRINNMASQIDVAAPWSHPQAAEWDAITVKDFVEQQTLSADTDSLLKCYFQPSWGSDAGNVSMLFFAWFIATAGNEDNVGTFQRSVRRTPRRTPASSWGRRRCRSGWPVSLATGSRSVHPCGASSSGTVGRTCTPPGDRPCEAGHRRLPAAARPRHRLGTAAPGTPPPPALEHADEPPDEVRCGLRDPVLAEGRPLGVRPVAHPARPARSSTTPRSGCPGVLLAFVGGSTWKTYGRLPLAQRKRAVLEGFAAMFGDEALHPIEYTEHDWTLEPWTTGGPIALPQPGLIASHASEIRKPFGRVHWAGTETSTYWSGFMDGAVRAGERAAGEVLEIL